MNSCMAIASLLGLEVSVLPRISARAVRLIIVVDVLAHTYAIASRLPAIVLDALLNIPYLLISIRNALLPVPPRVILPPPAAAAAAAPAAAPPRSVEAPAPAVEKQPVAEGTGTDSEHEHSETGSEADVESNSGVGESWVSLKSRSQEDA